MNVDKETTPISLLKLSLGDRRYVSKATFCCIAYRYEGVGGCSGLGLVYSTS
jgi:hypothetical protein